MYVNWYSILFELLPHYLPLQSNKDKISIFQGDASDNMHFVAVYSFLDTMVVSL